LLTSPLFFLQEEEIKLKPVISFDCGTVLELAVLVNDFIVLLIAFDCGTVKTSYYL
jgi:hypothetical protein